MAIGNTTEQWLGGIIIAGGGFVFLSGCGAGALQIVSWLRDGFWTPMTLQRVWLWLHLDGTGFDVLRNGSIVNHMMNWPLSTGLIVIGAGLLLVGTRLTD